MEEFDKGAKRKCTSCSTLFLILEKFPIICPNCGATVSTLLTNVSKRGRPPKVIKESDISGENKENELPVEDDIETQVDEDVNLETGDEDSVEEIVEISRDEES